MNNLVKHKQHKETLRVGNVVTTYSWDGKSKKPSVSYSAGIHTIPKAEALDSVLNSFEGTDTLPEDGNVLRMAARELLYRTKEIK